MALASGTMQATVIVSGGTGGLGSAVTARLLDDDWRVVVPYTDPGGLDRLPASPGLVTVQADLLDEAGAAAVVEIASGDPYAPLTALVNLVGGFGMGEKVGHTPVADFDALMRLNVRPLHLLSHFALPQIAAAGGGSVVGVSAKAAFNPFPKAAGYITSKAAVWAFISAVAAEYAEDGIRANAILPSVIDTPGNRESQPGADRAGWVSPEAIAKVVAFLVSEDAAAVTGAQIPVPGVAGHR